MLFSPDILLPDVFALDGVFLQKHGIKGIIFDIDNTLAGYSEPDPAPRVRALFQKLMGWDISLAIVSNNSRTRVERFSRELGISFYSRGAKPFPRFLNKVRKEFRLPAETVAVVGDQIFTDVLGGNLAGMITVLVDPLEKKETAFFRFKRALERPIIERKRKKEAGKK